MSLHQSIKARLKTVERHMGQDGEGPGESKPGDALNRWIDEQIGDPENNGSKTATKAGDVLVYTYGDALGAAGKVTGELGREYGHPERWPIASKAASLATRDLARELRAGREATPLCYSPDGYGGERFEIGALADLLKRAGFKQAWSPWEVWADNMAVLDTLKALGIPRDWKPA